MMHWWDRLAPRKAKTAEHCRSLPEGGRSETRQQAAAQRCQTCAWSSLMHYHAIAVHRHTDSVCKQRRREEGAY
jgi:hypothetical protein